MDECKCKDTVGSIVFNIEDSTEFVRLAKFLVNGREWAISMSKLDEWLRNQLKYNDFTEAKQAAYEEVRCEIRDILSEYNLVLEMVD